MIEEILELMGYVLGLIGGIESVAELRSRGAGHEASEGFLPEKDMPPAGRTSSPITPPTLSVPSSPAGRVSLIRRLRAQDAGPGGDGRRAG